MGRRAGRINANQLAHGLTAAARGEPTSMGGPAVALYEQPTGQPSAFTGSHQRNKQWARTASVPATLAGTHHLSAGARRHSRVKRRLVTRGGSEIICAAGDHVCRASRDAHASSLLPIFIFARADRLVLGREPIRGAVSSAAAGAADTDTVLDTGDLLSQFPMIRWKIRSTNFRKFE